MPTKVDKEAISELYEAVRDDNNETMWLTIRRDGDSLVVDQSGIEYDELLSNLTDEECKFAYIRVITGDELSKRAKFAFITWAAPGASAMRKAKLSIDKTELKNVIRNFAVETIADEKNEINYDHVKQLLMKAGGANYGTGSG